MRFVLCCFLMGVLSGCAQNSDVGIIGGADGMTTVFITSSLTAPQLIAMILLAAALIIGMIFFIRRKK